MKSLTGLDTSTCNSSVRTDFPLISRNSFAFALLRFGIHLKYFFTVIMSGANNYDNGIVLCTNGIYTLRKSYIINCKQLDLAHIVIKYNCALGIFINFSGENISKTIIQHFKVEL